MTKQEVQKVTLKWIQNLRHRTNALLFLVSVSGLQWLLVGGMYGSFFSLFLGVATLGTAVWMCSRDDRAYSSTKNYALQSALFTFNNVVLSFKLARGLL